ncbi:MAG: hypothetical protein R2716_09355 [Microthrixaceae bacterium]
MPEAFDMGVNCEPVHIGEQRDGLGRWTLVGEPDQVASRLSRYVEMGINQLQVRFVADSAAEYAEQLERFGSEVAPLLRPEAPRVGQLPFPAAARSRCSSSSRSLMRCAMPLSMDRDRLGRSSSSVLKPRLSMTSRVRSVAATTDAVRVIESSSATSPK